LYSESNEWKSNEDSDQCPGTEPEDSPPLLLKSYVVQSSPANKPITFNPFPNRQRKQPKEVGLKLGLYPLKNK